MLIGVRPIDPPLDLAAIGAPGCFLHVDALAALSSSFQPHPATAQLGGLANVLIDIPPSTALAGARFYSQWVEVATPLRTSNATEATIAIGHPRLGMAIATARPGGVGVEVDVALAPVLRFESR